MVVVVLRGILSGHASAHYASVVEWSYQTLVFSEKHSNAGVDFADCQRY